MAGNHDGRFIIGGSAVFSRSTSAVTPLSREEDRRSEVGLPGECFYLVMFFSCPLYMFSFRGSYRALTMQRLFTLTCSEVWSTEPTLSLRDTGQSLHRQKLIHDLCSTIPTSLATRMHWLVFRDLGQGKITFSLETTLVCFVVSACAS